MMERYHGEDPDHADDADAEDGDDRGDQCIAHALQRAGENLDGDVGDEDRHHELGDGNALADNLRIACEDLDEKAPPDVNSAGEHQIENRRDQHGLACAAADAVLASGAVVLTHQRRGGKAQGVDDHPVDGVDLPPDGPGGDGVRAEAVDGGLNQHIGEGIHQRPQRSRDADAQYFGGVKGIQTDLPEIDMHHAVGAQKVPEGGNGADVLGEDGRPCGAGDAQMQVDYKDNIQHDIGERSGHQIPERTPGIADGAQNGGTGIVEHVADHAAGIDAQVRLRHADGLIRRVHGAQHRACQSENNDGQHQSQDERQGNSGMHGLAQLVLAPCAVELCGNDGDAGGDADEQSDEEVNQGCGSAADGGKRQLADKASDDNRVNGVVQKLEKGPGQKGDKENKKLLPQNPSDHRILRHRSGRYRLVLCACSCRLLTTIWLLPHCKAPLKSGLYISVQHLPHFNVK